MLVPGIVLGLLVYGLHLAWRSHFRVEQGHVAVLTSFGRARRQSAGGHPATFGPGLHRKLPWEAVHDVAVMEQNLDLSGEEGGQTAMAADGTVLRFDSIVRYAPLEAELGAYLFGLHRPVEHITGLFTCLLRNEIANFRAQALAGQGAKLPVDGGSYALIRRERRLLNQRLEEFCRAQIGERYGVRFNAVDLTDILPPDELADALNAVIQAQSDADAQYARAESENQQRVLAAERGVQIAKARAEAIGIEIQRLGGFLEALAQQKTLDLYVARRRAEVSSEARTLYLRHS